MSVLTGGASTQSRCRRPLPEGWEPRVVRRGAISEAWKVKRQDGSEFTHGITVTYVFDQGGPVLGATSPLNNKTRPLLRTVERLAGATGMSGPGSVVSDLEIRAAKLLTSIVGPYVADGDLEMRWFANGSDACDAAVRVARAATGRDKFVSIGYHGNSVVFAHAPQNAGIPKSEDRIDVPFGDTQLMEESIRGAACIIVEVPSTDEDARSFLTACKRACEREDAVFILDEVVTGFRLALGGAAELYHVTPDLACYGKAMSNGRGISALVGWPKLMDELAERAFHSSTYNGDPWNCAHVVGTLSYLQKTPDTYEYLWRMGRRLIDGLGEVGVKCIGHAPRSALFFPSEDERRHFCAEMVRNHVVMDRPNYISLGHDEDAIAKTAEAARKALA